MSTPATTLSIKMEQFWVTNLEMELGGRNVENASDDFEIEMNHLLGLPRGDDLAFLVVFNLKLTEKVAGALRISLKAIAKFSVSEPVTKEVAKHPIIVQNAPAIAFPFVRSYVQAVTSLSGLPGIMLPVMSFKQAPTSSANEKSDE